MLNSAVARPKFSKMELKTNEYMVIGVIFQCVICLTAAFYSVWWENSCDVTLTSDMKKSNPDNVVFSEAEGTIVCRKDMYQYLGLTNDNVFG